MTEIAHDEVLKIAELAKLHFGEAELDALIHQFQRILDYVEKLKEVDIGGIEPTSHVSLAGRTDQTRLREDETAASLPVDTSLANAPDPGRGHFRVPKVI